MSFFCYWHVACGRFLYSPRDEWLTARMTYCLLFCMARAVAVEKIEEWKKKKSIKSLEGKRAPNGYTLSDREKRRLENCSLGDLFLSRTIPK